MVVVVYLLKVVVEFWLMNRDGVLEADAGEEVGLDAIAELDWKEEENLPTCKLRVSLRYDGSVREFMPRNGSLSYREQIPLAMTRSRSDFTSSVALKLFEDFGLQRTKLPDDHFVSSVLCRL